jgi:hypothetical protein
MVGRFWKIDSVEDLAIEWERSKGGICVNGFELKVREFAGDRLKSVW